MGNRDFVYEFVLPDRILMLHSAGNPPAAEWDAYLAGLREIDVTKAGIVVLTAGGAPDATQRKALNTVLDGRLFRRSIVTDSRVVRAMLTGLSWFAPGIQAFSPGDILGALEHVAWPLENRPLFWDRLAKLNEELNGPAPWMHVLASRRAA